MSCIILCYVDGMVVLIYVDLYCSFLLVFMCGYIVGVGIVVSPGHLSHGKGLPFSVR